MNDVFSSIRIKSEQDFSTRILFELEKSRQIQALMGNLPGVHGAQATVQVNLSDPVPVEDADATDWCSVCPPPTLGVQLPQSPPPEIDNRFEEAGRLNAPAQPQNTHTHCFHHLDLL